MPTAVTVTLLCTVLASAFVCFLRFSQHRADISLEVKRKTVPLYAAKAYEGVEVRLHSFLISALDCSEWLIHAPAVLPRYPLNRRLAWDPEPVWTFWKRKKCFAAAGIGTQDRPSRSLVTVATELPLYN
jgi:hypothetical protein